MAEPARGFAFLEHTADVGIRAWGSTLPDAFEEAGAGLASLMGLTTEPPGRTEALHVEGADEGGLLVALLDELVFRLETGEGHGLATLRIHHLDPTSLDAVIELASMEEPSDGLVVKAATYHQLAVSERQDGTAEVRVYLDV